MPKRKKGSHRRRVNRFVAGPLTVEQSGNMLFTRTNWAPGDFERHRERLKCERPELRRRIQDKISQIETIVQSYDPFSLLLAVSVQNCVGPPESWTEGSGEPNVCYAEYAQSLILAQDSLTFGREPSHEVMDKFQSLIKTLFDDVWRYFGLEMAEDDADKDQGYVRFLSILQYLFGRGDSFAHHHNDLMTELFAPHDTFLKTHYGFSSSEILSAVAEIERQLEEDLNGYVELHTGGIELLDRFADFAATYEGDSPKRLDETREAFLAVPEVGDQQRHLKDLHARIKEEPFSIEPNDRIPSDLLQLFSASFGDNRAFATFQRAPGWPTNDSVIHSRPLVEHRGNYYCFVPQLLFNNIGQILGQWIQAKDDVYFQTGYQKERGRYLEAKAVEYMGNILPGAQLFGELYYPITEEGQPKRVSTDGLILYDKNLIVIEAKAGSLHAAARRGGLKKLEKDCKEIVEGAYRQARRTLSYIRKTDVPRFEDKNGKEALVLNNKTEFSDFWMINVSGANLGHLAARLNSLRALNLMQVTDWPWSVFVNDLRVISELIEFPSEFFHYLRMRLQLNEFPQFSPLDELDVFMFYLRKGLHFDSVKLAQLDSFLPIGFTRGLQRYHDHLSGLGPVASKPSLNISDAFKHFIIAIESTRRTGRTRLVTKLLDLSRHVQDETVSRLREFVELSRERGECHDFSIRDVQANAAMTFFLYASYDEKRLYKMRSYSQMLKYHYRLDEYALITVDTGKQGWTGLDFETFGYRWTCDRQMEEVVKSLKMRRVETARKAQGKIGRNVPCPCGSGKKFKKCCG